MKIRPNNSKLVLREKLARAFAPSHFVVAFQWLSPSYGWRFRRYAWGLV